MTFTSDPPKTPTRLTANQEDISGQRRQYDQITATPTSPDPKETTDDTPANQSEEQNDDEFSLTARNLHFDEPPLDPHISSADPVLPAQPDLPLTTPPDPYVTDDLATPLSNTTADATTLPNNDIPMTDVDHSPPVFTSDAITDTQP